jgi:hypothetical protein
MGPTILYFVTSATSQPPAKPSLQQCAEVAGRVLATSGLLSQVAEDLAAHRVDGLAVPGPKLWRRHVAICFEELVYLIPSLMTITIAISRFADRRITNVTRQ